MADVVSAPLDIPAHPGQGHQLVEPARHLAPEVVAEGLGEPQQRLGLGTEEPGWLDQLLQLGTVGRRQRLRASTD